MSMEQYTVVTQEKVEETRN